MSGALEISVPFTADQSPEDTVNRYIAGLDVTIQTTDRLRDGWPVIRFIGNVDALVVVACRRINDRNDLNVTELLAQIQ